MVGRKKSKQARSKGLSQRLKEDRISQLHDPLICEILSHLPTKDAVKTSMLSTRWRSLWLWVPGLDLNSREFPDFNALVSFGDMFFDSNKVSCINKLKLTIDGIRLIRDGTVNDVASYLTSLIDAAVKRKIQHLDVLFHPNTSCIYIAVKREMQLLDVHLLRLQRLYDCETLVSLKLSQVTLDEVMLVSFPCLKTMHLKEIRYPNEATFKTLISGCPVLEDLRIFAFGDDAKDLRVHSQSLKRLTFGGSASGGVVIDAPLLCCLKISVNVSKSFIVNNLDSNVKLDISLFLGFEDINETMRSTIHSFLSLISRVKDMTIRADTFKVIYQYSKLEPLPQFGYMTRLWITLHAFNLKWFPIFLRSCPNLKSLILGKIGDFSRLSSKKIKQVSFSSVPECLLSSLEFVDIKAPIMGLAIEMKLVRYFLENSAILKKLSLCLATHSKKDEICKEVFEIPRGSTKCEVVIL